MNRGLKSCAAGALTLVLLSAPLGAMAAETAPLVLAEEAQSTGTGRTLSPFGVERGSRGVSASTEWLTQARIGGMSLGLRLFTPMGDAVVFQECLRPVESGSRYLELQIAAVEWTDGMLMQIDQHAVDVLERSGITSIVLADEKLGVREVYTVEELNALRKLFSLGEGEQLCLSGEDAPLTAVSEEGVRRQLTK